MKKKTSWKTFAGLALVAGTWLKLAGDFPIAPLITPPGPPPPLQNYLVPVLNAQRVFIVN